MMDLFKAIEWYTRKHPSIYNCGEGYKSLDWHEDNELPKPSETDLEIAWNEFIKDFESKEYRRNREKEYPPITTQLDVMYNQGFDAWRKHIYSIKAKYPSPKGTAKLTFENPLEPIESRMTIIETKLETDLQRVKQEMADLQAAIIDTKGAIYAIKGFMMEIPNIQKALTELSDVVKSK